MRKEISMNPQAVPYEVRPFITANQRFKQSYGAILSFCLILATIAHWAVFNYWPEMMAKDVSYTADELVSIDLPPEIEIPPAPQTIARPAIPVIATTNIDEDITIAPTTFEMNPVEALPPPPTDDITIQRDISEAPVFTPYTVQPDIKNREEVSRAMEREYPALLRDAGIGGQVLIWFFIDENGVVKNTLVKESSGHKALDDAALKVADIIEFTPALNRDKQVPVWISLPVTFRTR